MASGRRAAKRSLRGPLLALVVLAATGSLATASAAVRHSGNVSRWIPPARISWQWQLNVPIDRRVNAQLYDIDLFDNPARTVNALHRQGRSVICYLDAGTYETGRPDAGRFPSWVLGNSNGWPGEQWLDIRQLSVLEPIMRARLALCKRRHFNGVEADNVDAYDNSSGFPITAGQQLTYNKWLARTAHQYGLSIALKNDLGQVKQLQPYFDFAMVEGCFEDAMCSRLRPFIKAHKAVLDVEYNLGLSQFCSVANGSGIMAIRKSVMLGPSRQTCW